MSFASLLSHVRWQEGTQSSNTAPPLQDTPEGVEETKNKLIKKTCHPLYLDDLPQYLVNGYIQKRRQL